MKHYARLAVVAVAVSMLSSTVLSGQTLNPLYLSEMPNPAVGRSIRFHAFGLCFLGFDSVCALGHEHLSNAVKNCR
jgi:hypothetical protein